VLQQNKRHPMSTSPLKTVSTIIPTLRYRDAKAAIAFLQRAFGFEPKLVVEGDGDMIEHAQLTFGNGMIMLSSLRDGEYDTHLVHPSDIDRRQTQAPYILVEDPDSHHDQAKEAGAEIVIELTSPGHGGRLYAARDPEGYMWNFGSYDPWVDV